MKTLKDTLLISLCLILAFGLIGLIIAAAVTDKPHYNNPIGADLTNGWYYALTTKVVAIDQEADIVTCEDCNGNLWQFSGVEDWEVGDCASLLMESHGTKKIEDDTIEDVRFSAWELTR